MSRSSSRHQRSHDGLESELDISKDTRGVVIGSSPAKTPASPSQEPVRSPYSDRPFQDGSSSSGSTSNAESIPASGSISADAAWVLVLPAQNDQRPSGQCLEASFSALLQHRKRKAAVSVLLYEPDSSLPDRESQVEAWAERSEVAKIIDQGFYFFIAGDLQDVPFALSRYLAHGKLVGRICCTTNEDYERYCTRVVSAETLNDSPNVPALPSHPILLFSPMNDRDLKFLHRELVRPLSEALEQVEIYARSSPTEGSVSEARRIVIDKAFGQEARWSSVPELITSSRPSVLFTACHGSSGGDQSEPTAVGALLDWSGEFLDPAKVESWNGPFFDDGIAVLYSCYAGGKYNPDDAIRGFLSAENTHQKTDMMSEMIRAILSRDNGPLAVVSHYGPIFLDELASDNSGENPYSTVEGVTNNIFGPGGGPAFWMLTALFRGAPVGIALQRLRRAYAIRTAKLERILSQLYHKLAKTEELEGYEKDQLTTAYRQWYACGNWEIYGDPRYCLEGKKGTMSVESILRSAQL